MEKQIMWAVYDRKGCIQIGTLQWCRKDAIQRHIEGQETYTWAEVRKFGWTVRKVEVTIKSIFPSNK